MNSRQLFGRTLLRVPALILLAAGCALADRNPGVTEEVTVVLPSYPAELPPLTGWLLVWEEGSAEARQILPPETRSVTLRLLKNRCSPALFFPLNISPESSAGSEGAYLQVFQGGGCIYPFSVDASWQDGFGAKLLLDILTHQGGEYKELRSFCESFNWKRFQNEIAALADQDPFYNPWNINRGKIFASFAAGKFSKTLLKEDAANADEGSLAYVPLAGYTLGQ
ncbi:MAG: hypothetical protein LBS97_03315 [Treponema sp.]|jgi:hypothetical protein|nr:hypothetical protein [Treponema sp.]